MDRRQFLTVGGLAAAAPAFGQSIAEVEPMPRLFQDVNFFHDGLALTPPEYATLLQEAAMSRELKVDNYSNGGIVADLERQFAQRLGKQAAMFVPTGTLANHLALRKLAGDDRRVIVQAESHVHNDSGDCAQVLSGLSLIPLGEGRSAMELAELQGWVERSMRGRVAMRVGAICIESPVRRRDHKMVGFAELERLSRYAREQGIRLHLDGARLFNLPYHSGKSVREHAALFDTVYVSLWKHFNASSGAILAGDASFIDGLYHTRRMFGGSLPHAWPVLAVAARYLDLYEDEYAQAWHSTDRMIALLEADQRFQFRKLPNGTSRYFMKVSGVPGRVLAERAARRGVLLPHPHPGTGEFALQVNPSVLRSTPEALAQVFLESLE